MRTTLIALILAATLITTTASAEETVRWETDYDTAMAKAEETGRYVFVFFTGSNWCIYCMIINNRFFKKPEFIKLANEQFICLEVDFPRGEAAKGQSDELKAFNQKLTRKHYIRSYPTIIITNKKGVAIGRTGYQKKMDAAQFVDHLSEMIDKNNVSKPKPYPAGDESVEDEAPNDEADAKTGPDDGVPEDNSEIGT